MTGQNAEDALGITLALALGHTLANVAVETPGPNTLRIAREVLDLLDRRGWHLVHSDSSAFTSESQDEEET